MSPPRPRLSPSSQHTIRARLTLFYSGLFLLSGTGLLTITYLLVRGATGDAYIATDRTEPPQPQLRAFVAQQQDAVLERLLGQSGISLTVMAIASVVLGWLVAGRVLRPIRTIVATVRDISTSNLHRRLALTGPADELTELGDTFDQLLQRLQASFEAQKHFVSNASHELRTPIARQRTLVEVALGDPHPTVESLRTLAERVLVACEHQERLITAMLTLAQSERGVDHREPVDVAAIVGALMRTRTSEIQRRGLRITGTLVPAVADGDAHLLERLAANLLDNAIQHNISEGLIEVSTRTADGHAIVAITNTGPVIPAEQIDRLLLPFQRLASSRTGHGGLGLGLSIVRAVAIAHDAALVVRTPDGGGLCVEVHFPTGERSRECPINGG